MRRLLYVVTAITLIVAFGVVLIGCSGPSNADIKKAVIAYEREAGLYLTQEDIVIEKVGMVRIIPGALATIEFYPVKVRIRGAESNFLLHKNNYTGEWVAQQWQ